MFPGARPYKYLRSKWEQDLRFIFPCRKTGRELIDMVPDPCFTCIEYRYCVAYFAATCDIPVGLRTPFKVYKKNYIAMLTRQGGIKDF